MGSVLRFVRGAAPVFLFILALAAVTPSGADADTITTFNVTGTFADSSTLSGTMSIDVTSGQVTGADLVASDLGTSTPLSIDPSALPIAIGTFYITDVLNSSQQAEELALVIPSGSLIGYTGGSLCSDDNPAINCYLGQAFYNSGFRGNDLQSGTLTAAGSITTSPTPTPEPSTVSLLGSALLALFGLGLRRSWNRRVFFG